jgi:hypothetical protein
LFGGCRFFHFIPHVAVVGVNFNVASLSLPASVGIVAAGCLLLVIVLGIVVCLICRRRRRRGIVDVDASKAYDIAPARVPTWDDEHGSQRAGMVLAAAGTTGAGVTTGIYDQIQLARASTFDSASSAARSEAVRIRWLCVVVA